SVDEDLVLEAFLHSLIDYVAEAFAREPDDLTYARKWLFHKEALRRIVPTSVAEDAIKDAVDLVRKESRRSIEKMLEAYGSKDKPKTAPKNAKAVKEIMERLKKNKKNDISTDMLAGFLESNLLRCPNRNASRLLKHIEVRTCAFYNGQDPCGWLDYSLPGTMPRALPWRSGRLRYATLISEIGRSRVSWADEAAEEIRRQSETEAERPPKFYLTYPFSEPINAINDPGTKVTDLIYEFMVIDESRTLPESFLRWCEAKGFRFYRKSDMEGCLQPGIRSIKNCFDYSFMNHKDLYLMKFRPNELKCSEGALICPKNRMCKIKAREEEDLECDLCRNFKESFSALFGKDKLGFYQWLDRKGLITNMEYQIYLDGIKVKTVSKADLLALAKELEEK
ncbi:MAG: hypothetical protein JW724_06045, partial [Candidatus Altiarchaeota archaeon]|nr:hypothetical protein [Candidatus Altiarchaeota archaeon]